ncbi:MAG: ATP-binding cassette domain-containing protein, partial [Mucinivorans sp.]
MAINLQVENLSKSFGERVLFENISFTVESGERVGLIAANGSGKTTLLNIIAAGEDYSSGAITIPRGARVSYLKQDPQFPSGLTVLEAAFHSDSEMVKTIASYEQIITQNDEQALSAVLERMDSL